MQDIQNPNPNPVLRDVMRKAPLSTGGKIFHSFSLYVKQDGDTTEK